MSETLGQYLVGCRQRKGLTVEEIAEITRINSRLIRAAEEDRFDQLPGRVFIKGLLRAYAQVIGIDGEDIIKRYDALGLVIVDNSPEMISMPLYRDSAKTSTYILAIVILSTFVLVGVYLTKKPTSNKAMSTLKPKVSSEQMGALNPRPKSLPKAMALTPEQAQMAAQPVSERPVSSAGDDKIPVVEKVPASTEPVVNHKLRIYALEDTWIKTIIDGEVVKEIILRQGKTVIWDARLGFIVNIGNVAGTHIYHNGLMVNLPQPTSNIITDLRLPESAPRLKNPPIKEQKKEKTDDAQ